MGSIFLLLVLFGTISQGGLLQVRPQIDGCPYVTGERQASSTAILSYSSNTSWNVSLGFALSDTVGWVKAIDCATDQTGSCTVNVAITVRRSLNSANIEDAVKTNASKQVNVTRTWQQGEGQEALGEMIFDGTGLWLVKVSLAVMNSNQSAEMECAVILGGASQPPVMSPPNGTVEPGAPILVLPQADSLVVKNLLVQGHCGAAMWINGVYSWHTQGSFSFTIPAHYSVTAQFVCAISKTTTSYLLTQTLDAEVNFTQQLFSLVTPWVEGEYDILQTLPSPQISPSQKDVPWGVEVIEVTISRSLLSAEVANLTLMYLLVETKNEILELPPVSRYDLYREAIKITRDSTVIAFAAAPGFRNSPVVMAVYVLGTGEPEWKYIAGVVIVTLVFVPYLIYVLVVELSAWARHRKRVRAQGNDPHRGSTPTVVLARRHAQGQQENSPFGVPTHAKSDSRRTRSMIAYSINILSSFVEPVAAITDIIFIATCLADDGMPISYTIFMSFFLCLAALVITYRITWAQSHYDDLKAIEEQARRDVEHSVLDPLDASIMSHEDLNDLAPTDDQGRSEAARLKRLQHHFFPLICTFEFCRATPREMQLTVRDRAYWSGLQRLVHDVPGLIIVATFSARYPLHTNDWSIVKLFVAIADIAFSFIGVFTFLSIFIQQVVKLCTEAAEASSASKIKREKPPSPKDGDGDAEYDESSGEPHPRVVQLIGNQDWDFTAATSTMATSPSHSILKPSAMMQPTTQALEERYMNEVLLASEVRLLRLVKAAKEEHSLDSIAVDNLLQRAMDLRDQSPARDQFETLVKEEAEACVKRREHSRTIDITDESQCVGDDSDIPDWSHQQQQQQGGKVGQTAHVLPSPQAMPSFPPLPPSTLLPHGAHPSQSSHQSPSLMVLPLPPGMHSGKMMQPIPLAGSISSTESPPPVQKQKQSPQEQQLPTAAAVAPLSQPVSAGVLHSQQDGHAVLPAIPVKISPGDVASAEGGDTLEGRRSISAETPPLAPPVDAAPPLQTQPRHESGAAATATATDGAVPPLGAQFRKKLPLPFPHMKRAQVPQQQLVHTEPQQQQPNAIALPQVVSQRSGVPSSSGDDDIVVSSEGEDTVQRRSVGDAARYDVEKKEMEPLQRQGAGDDAREDGGYSPTPDLNLRFAPPHQQPSAAELHGNYSHDPFGLPPQSMANGVIEGRPPLSPDIGRTVTRFGGLPSPPAVATITTTTTVPFGDDLLDDV